MRCHIFFNLSYQLRIYLIYIFSDKKMNQKLYLVLTSCLAFTQDSKCLIQKIYSGLLTLTEKVMAAHSSTLAWKIAWMEEPGRLQSMGSLGVGHDWVTSLSLCTFMHWRRKWQPTPVFLPGESQRRRSLVGCCLWGRTESDTTEVTQQQLTLT